MRKVSMVIAIGLMFMFSGCSYTLENGKLHSDITGNSYDVKQGSEIIYQVVKGGVIMLMTKKEIEAKGLDKANDVVITIHNIAKKNVTGASTLAPGIK